MSDDPKIAGMGMLDLVDEIQRVRVQRDELRAEVGKVTKWYADAKRNLAMESEQVRDEQREKGEALRTVERLRTLREDAARMIRKYREERDRYREALLTITEEHAPVSDGQGFTDGRSGPACRACGEPDEYAVEWPCQTAQIARAALAQEDDK